MDAFVDPLCLERFVSGCDAQRPALPLRLPLQPPVPPGGGGMLTQPHGGGGGGGGTAKAVQPAAAAASGSAASGTASRSTPGRAPRADKKEVKREGIQ